MLLNIFTFNDLHGYLVENPIQTLIIRRHIVFLVWFIKRAWAACGSIYWPTLVDVQPVLTLGTTDITTDTSVEMSIEALHKVLDPT